jgi:hypothetical protein
MSFLEKSTVLHDMEVPMKPVTFSLKLQMKRAEVGDLHQALSALGFTIAVAEKKNQRFVARKGDRRVFKSAKLI